jgi:hypothetical protein
MKPGIFEKLAALLDGKGKAMEAIANIPDGGMPPDLPQPPETEAMGPPESLPPVDTDGMPGVDPFTGLPLIAVENTPDQFPGNDEHEPDADAIGALFGI